jgi:hypothetical protein
LSKEESSDDVYDYFVYNMDDLLHESDGPGRYIADRGLGEHDSDHDS